MSDSTRASSPVPGHRQRPLMMQLALASGAIAQPSLHQKKYFGNDFWVKEEGKQARASMEKVVAGIKKYQTHPYERTPLSRSVMWEDGAARLVWYGAQLKKNQQRARAGVVLIPSLINGSEILDILPNKRSLLRWLTKQGIDVYLMEWTNIRDDDEFASLENLIAQKMARMLSRLKNESPDIPLFGLGYCMGGLFLAASEIINPDIFDGLVFVATPWDFKAGAKGNFAEALTGWAKDGLTRVAHLDYMPAEWLQMIFAGVDPQMTVRKFTAFDGMKQNSSDAVLFVAVEDWVNGGCDLPAGIIRDAVQEWYVGNQPVRGQWVVDGKKINPRKIKKPTLVIVPSKDKIVPPESAIPLAMKIPDADILEPDCGHISMMVSSRAEVEVWEPMCDWILSTIR